mgnify:CR=1 FL=1
MRLLKLLPAYLLFALLLLIVQNVNASKNSEGQNDTIKIGMLIPDNKSIAAKHGAEMAIRNANKKGGLNSGPFQIIVRSMEGS